MHYQVGGSLTTDAPSYIERQADSDFTTALRRGEFCYVLNSRQMGKSSLMVRAHQQFRAAGYRCAVLDMTNIGSENITPLQWYKGIVKDLWRSFKLTRHANFKFKDWWKDEEDISLLQRLSQFIKDGLLAQFPNDEIIVFIDEIDSILSLPFSVDDFFALVRFCYNQRAIDPDYKRIHFAIFGVATPADLIQNRTRTPFNIGTPIYLAGFNQAEAQPLARGLAVQAGDAQAVLKAIIGWTNGQPFLTQKLCQLAISSSQDAVATPLTIPPGNEAYWVDELVRTRVLNRWESQDEPEHLRTIRNRILNNPDTAGRLLAIYQQVLENEVPADDSREQVELILSGLVHKAEGYLRVKNRIYGEIFNADWVKQQLDHLRPYAGQLDAWAASAHTDESRLLRGQALKDAQQWSQGKRLSDLDYQYLAASVESDRKAIQQGLEAQRVEAVEAQLVEEQARLAQEKKTLHFQRLLLGGTVGALLITGGLGLVALKQSQNAKTREVEALISAASGSFDSHRQLEAIVQALQANQKLGSLSNPEASLREEVQTTLQQVVMNADEINRFNFASEIQDAVFSPDGQHIAVATADGLLSLRKPSGEIVWEIPAHAESVNAVTFSTDGQLIATASSDRTVKLWQLDATPVTTDIQGTESLSRVQFLPEGQSIVAAGRNTIGRWQIAGEQMTSTRRGALRAVSPDGSFLVVIRLPKTADNPIGEHMPVPRTLNPDAAERNRSLAGLPKSKGPLRRTPGSKAVARTPSRKPNTMIVDANDNLITQFHTEDGPIFSVAVSADSQLIATAGVDGAVHIWNKDGTFKQALIGNKSDVREIAFSPDGEMLATAGDDQVIRLWQINGGLIKTFEGHQAEVNKLIFSPDSQRLVSTSDDQTLKLWQVKETQHQVLAGHGDAIRQLTFNAYSQLFSGAVDRWLNIWQQQGDSFASLPVQQITPGDPRPTALTTYDSETALSFEFGRVKIWKSAGSSLAGQSSTGQPPADYQLQQTLEAGTKINQLLYSPDGNYLIATTRDDSLKYWQREPSGQFPTVPTGASEAIENPDAIAISPDGQTIAVATGNHTLTMLNNRGDVIKTVAGHKADILSIAISPDGQWIATASKDRTLRVWPLEQVLSEDLISEDLILEDFDAAEMGIFATQSIPIAQIAFTADSKLLITALTDGTLNVWETATGTLKRTLSGHESALNAISVSPDGEFVASAGRDRKIILWHLPEILSQDEVEAACQWIENYLKNNMRMKDNQNLCLEQ
ncbi:MAG: AAA-like domain-containing protein [Cyanobacteria bacterium J06635_11]